MARPRQATRRLDRRSQEYQNMCEPLDYREGGLLRDKIQSVDGCTRKLASNLPDIQQNVFCKLDRNNKDNDQFYYLFYNNNQI